MGTIAGAAIVPSIYPSGNTAAQLTRRDSYREMLVDRMAPVTHVNWLLGGRYTAMFDPDYHPETDIRNTIPCPVCGGSGIYRYEGDDWMEPCYSCTVAYDALAPGYRMVWWSHQGGGYWGSLGWGSGPNAITYPEPGRDSRGRFLPPPDADPIVSDGAWMYAQANPGRQVAASSEWVHGRDVITTKELLHLRGRVRQVPLAVLAPDGRWHETERYESANWGSVAWKRKFWSLIDAHPTGYSVVALECTV